LLRRNGERENIVGEEGKNIRQSRRKNKNEKLKRDV
jgi:hypothetical protein